ncbi:GNAT family N-acetyltransferase [Micromonospora sp. RB23]
MPRCATPDPPASRVAARYGGPHVRTAPDERSGSSGSSDRRGSTDLTTRKAVGSISYLDISPNRHSLEIGWAWLTPRYWRTGAIREASHLLMRHAFNDLGTIRVAFKTDSRNTRSQQAIKGLGTTEEGTFRNHRILRDATSGIRLTTASPAKTGPQ